MGKRLIPPDVIELAGTSKRDTNSLAVLDRPAQVIDVPGPSKRGMVGRQGFEPWKPMATDLQSAPFVHLGTCPNIKLRIQFPASRQEQTTPHSFPLFKRTKREDCSGWGRHEIREAGNFTHDIARCQELESGFSSSRSSTGLTEWQERLGYVDRPGFPEEPFCAGPSTLPPDPHQFA